MRLIDPLIKNCNYINASDLVPEKWQDYIFLDELFEDIDFNREGDLDVVLMSINNFADLCSEHMETLLEYNNEKNEDDETPKITKEQFDKWIMSIRNINLDKQLYIRVY